MRNFDLLLRGPSLTVVTPLSGDGDSLRDLLVGRVDAEEGQALSAAYGTSRKRYRNPRHPETSTEVEQVGLTSFLGYRCEFISVMSDLIVGFSLNW